MKKNNRKLEFVCEPWDGLLGIPGVLLTYEKLRGSWSNWAQVDFKNGAHRSTLVQENPQVRERVPGLSIHMVIDKGVVILRATRSGSRVCLVIALIAVLPQPLEK